MQVQRKDRAYVIVACAYWQSSFDYAIRFISLLRALGMLNSTASLSGRALPPIPSNISLISRVTMVIRIIRLIQLFLVILLDIIVARLFLINIRFKKVGEDTQLLGLILYCSERSEKRKGAEGPVSSLPEVIACASRLL